MPDPTRALPLVLLAALAVAAAGAAPTASASPHHDRRAVQTLQATLQASGDPDGSGHADLRLNKARHKVCADITWSNIAQPDSAHVHRASDGSIVVDLSGAVTGGSHCTTAVSSATVGKILAHPKRYYVNVHNPDHPAGAIQGKLHR